MEMELLALKVEVIEKTLAAFQKDMEQKMKLVEQLLSSRNEQFAAQKFLLEKEELIHRSLWNSWEKCTVEKETNKHSSNSKSDHSERFESSHSSTIQLNDLPIPTSTSTAYIQGNGQGGGGTITQRRVISPRGQDLSSFPAMRHFANSDRITVTKYQDPLGSSSSPRNSLENLSQSRGSESLASSPPVPELIQQNQRLLHSHPTAYSYAANTQQRTESPISHVQDNTANERENEQQYEDEEEEVQVLDIKCSITAKEGIDIENPQISSSRSSDINNSVRVNANTNIQQKQSSRGPEQANCEIISMLPNTPSSSSSPAPNAPYNFYSMLRNKYRNKRSSAIYHHNQNNAPISIHSYQSLQPHYHNNPALRSSSHPYLRIHSLQQSHQTSSTADDNALRKSCPDCGKIFGRFSTLKKHREEQVCSKCFECAVCTPSTSTTINYFNEHHEIQAHMLHVHKLRKFRVCQFCRKCFGPFRGLLEHQLEQHREQAAKEAKKFKHKCMLCPKSYSTRNDLVCHSRSHTGERPFSCSKCERTFADCRNMKKHQLTCMRKEYSVNNSLIELDST